MTQMQRSGCARSSRSTARKTFALPEGRRRGCWRGQRTSTRRGDSRDIIASNRALWDNSIVQIALGFIGGLVALLVVRATLTAVALKMERRRWADPSSGAPAVSIVIPLKGWDDRFLELLDALERSAQRYSGDAELIVVVDDSHERRADIAARAWVQVLSPTITHEPGDSDKVRRMRCGVNQAQNGLVLFLDSDVVIDDDFLARRLAVHARDRELRLSFALPTYLNARGFGDRMLASYTVHNNLTLFFLGWWLLREGTSIGVAQAVRNDDGVLAALLEGIRKEIADDHALGFAVKSRGERITSLAIPVVVHASDPSFSAARRQIMRWMSASKTVTSMMTVRSAAFGALMFGLSGAGFWLGVAAVACMFAAPEAVAVLVAGAFGLPVIDGGLCVVLEKILTGRTRYIHVVGVPLYVFLQPLWFARALLQSRVPWRGALFGE
jgi:hypothetical protein